MTTQHPEALRLAEELDDGYPLTGDAISAAAELRSQHARITELEAQLSAIGAGGVSPLMNAAQEATHLRELAAYRLTVENLEREIAAINARRAGKQDSVDLTIAYLDGFHSGKKAQQPAPSAAAALPEGWVPLVITHEGQYPEEVAYGPQIMMDRLAKWLGQHFERTIEEKAAAQQPAPSPAPASPLQWTPGPNAFKDWCSQWFGPDSDDTYLANAVHALPAMAQRFAQPAPTAQADAQPAQQGVSYAALPESFLEIPDVQDESGINAYYSREVVLECIDAALASHGQAPAHTPADSVLEDAEIDRIVPALEPVSEDFPAEWAVWKDRERIREELRAARKQGEKQ